MLTESFSDHFVKPELALEMLMNINISLFGSPEDVKRYAAYLGFRLECKCTCFSLLFL